MRRAVCFAAVVSLTTVPTGPSAVSAAARFIGNATAIVQETSSPVVYSGAWTHESTQRSWSGGTAAISTSAGAQVTLTFSGVGVSWIGFRGPQGGIARVLLDGVLAATVDTFAPVEEVRAAVFSTAALPDAAHTLTIQVTGGKNPLSSGVGVVVDAFEIVGGAAGLVDTTPPSVTITSPEAGASVPVGLVLRATAVDDFAVTGVRFLLDGVDLADARLLSPYWTFWDTRLVPEGPVRLTALASDEAGNVGSTEIVVTVDRTPPVLAMTSPAPGATVAGSVRISASALDDVGVDRVWFSADGVWLGEDATPPYELVWETLLITDGTYVLKAASRDAAGGLNSTFATVTVSNGTTHLEDTSAAIVYSGTWADGNVAREWSGGTASVATLTFVPAQATLSFNGTGVHWVGFRGPQAGIARVYLDGVQVGTIDLYDRIEHLRTVVFSVTGLPSGDHTLIVEATGTRNPMSSDPFVVVDGFLIATHQ